MPHALELVAACAYNQWCNLFAPGTVGEACQIIAECRVGVNEVIEVLYFSYRPEPTQCQSDSLTNNGGFPDPRIRYTVRTIFILHALHSLIYITQSSGILTKGYKVGVPAKQFIEVAAENL